MAKGKAGELRVADEPGKTSEQQLAEIAIDGVAPSALTCLMFSNGAMGELGLTESVQALRQNIAKVNQGDLSGLEGMLMGQATALGTIFQECSRRAAINMGEYPEAVERYLRLGLKAQSQCRTTLQALAEMKIPRQVSYVRQANIANGHQQVNNGCPDAAAHTQPAQETQIEPNELLEMSNVTRLDTRAPSSAIRSDTAVEAVGAVNRPTKRRGQGRG